MILPSRVSMPLYRMSIGVIPKKFVYGKNRAIMIRATKHGSMIFFNVFICQLCI